MPIVETYWQLADDEKEFLGFLDSTGRILSLPATWVESKRELIPQPIDQFVDQNDPDQLLFGFAEDVLRAGVDERDFGSGLRFAVPYMKPCLLSYNRGRFRNGKLTQSNLSGYMDYPNEDASTLLKKDPDFVHWVNK